MAVGCNYIGFIEGPVDAAETLLSFHGKTLLEPISTQIVVVDWAYYRRCFILENNFGHGNSVRK